MLTKSTETLVVTEAKPVGFRNWRLYPGRTMVRAAEAVARDCSNNTPGTYDIEVRQNGGPVTVIEVELTVTARFYIPRGDK